MAAPVRPSPPRRHWTRVLPALLLVSLASAVKVQRGQRTGHAPPLVAAPVHLAASSAAGTARLEGKHGVQGNLSSNASSFRGLHQGNASHNASQQLPFSANVQPAVGKVFSLYYSSYSDAKATSVEANDEYSPAAKQGDVWHGATILPHPSCGLQLRSQTNYPTDNREANLRLAAIAVCELLESKFVSLPSCGAASDQVCELTLFAPMPSSDELQEPYIAAAMGLVAFSKVCSLSKDPDLCRVFRSNSAICAGLRTSGGQVALRGLGSPGQLDLKLEDAYLLGLKHVYLAEEDRAHYHETQFYSDLPDVLKWQHTPPQVAFCSDLACLTSAFLPTGA